jgi:hypothetical protein
MMEELLEKQTILSDIAGELYGELWIMNEKFWGSPTERELQEVTMSLLNLGHSVENTPEGDEAAKIVAKKFGFKLPPED